MYPDLQSWLVRGFLAGLIMVFLAAPRARAQYFGQNKVQYDDFKFEVLRTEHFDIYFYAEEKKAAEEAARMAERWYARHASILQHDLSDRQPLILYASHAQFEQTNAVGGQIGEGTGGVTEGLKRRIVLPFAGPIAETDHVIGHELVHAFQYDITGLQTGGNYRAPRAESMPLWFIEGMAEFLSLGPVDPHTAMWMRDAVKSEKKLPKVQQLENPQLFPYRWGQALLSYISGRWGDATIGDLLKNAAKTGDIYKSISLVLGESPDSLSADWHKAMRDYYEPFAGQTAAPKDLARELISKKQGAGELNVGPVLSPDGKNMIFFSERNLFSIDLFLANAQSGKIRRNLVRTDQDPHYESLGFISSAGAWDARGERIALGITTQGRPALSIIDVRHDKTLREIPLKKLGEIFNPTWAPDGKAIAFSALNNGMSDLFIYDLQKNALKQVSSDFYSDLQPAWSPDGKSIAFVTDRFSTKLAVLKPGAYQLALYNVETEEITPVPGFARGKHINPQWSADGRSLYFLSDRTGITNIYRIDLASGALFQLTNLYTGISGITALSPALSVAQQAHVLSFSAYEHGQYNIYTIDKTEALEGTPVAITGAEDVSSKGPAPGVFDRDPAVLPPAVRATNGLTNLLANYTAGLADAEHQLLEPYRPRLSLIAIGQPYLAAGYDTYGAHLGGGISLFWSDLLGNRNLALATQAQVDGTFKDFAGQIGYSNTARRLNWAAVIQQVPYEIRSLTAGYGTLDSMDVYVEEEFRVRQINRELAGLLAYPFNRAQRVEFSAGVQLIGFARQVRTRAVDLNSGRQVLDRTTDLPAPGSIGLATASLALVYDTSIFGATSPILGQSYRFEVSPYVGTITTYNLLADYRKYLVPHRPFTLAARFIHFGRYGRDAEDDRLSPLFIGYPGLVRGYDSNSFDQSECEPTAEDDCPAFSRLLGSRIALANFELRFPFFGALGIGHSYYGIFPLETGIFYDAGVAWDRHDKASFLGGDRKILKSYGAAFRINLLGYAVAEIDYVNPVDRPRKGWFWQFNFTTGF